MWFVISFLLLWTPILLVIFRFIVLPIMNGLTEKRVNDGLVFGLFGMILVALIVLAVFAHGYFFFDWGEPVPNEITYNPSWEITSNAFYKREEKNGMDYLTFADSANGKIEFRVANIDYSKQEKLEWKIVVTSETGETKEPEGNLIHTNKYYDFLISKEGDLFYGANKVSVSASNKRGTATKEFVINRLSLNEECKKPENSELRVCRKEEDVKEEHDLNNSSSDTGNPGGSSGVSGGCVHYEFGECWDEIEEQAYDDGYLDASYGAGHIRYTGCSGICADIYEEAYEKGYYDGEYDK